MGKYDDLDAFWDLGRLMPKKKKLTPFNTSTTPKEHIIEGNTPEKSDERKITLIENDVLNVKTDEHSYEPKQRGLIKKVTIIRSIDRYDFYGNFRKAALVYYDYKTDKCDFAPYYSYLPQYSQLTMPQKQYYFYWRDMVRRGKYIKSDYSYLYLFVYEILNLPDKVPPEEGLKLLCTLWKEYRDDLPKIDTNFAIWIQDYCLVHEIPCPMEYVSEFIFDVISASSFKEFYLSAMGEAGDAGTDAMIAYLSDYDFRRCRYRTAENREIYTKYMLGAVSRVISSLMNSENPIYDSSKTTIIEREAFPRSLCTHAVKCRLRLEYTPLSQDAKLRAIVTASVRYTENKLRAFLGVKSRLAIKDFPDEYKRLIDGYFDYLVSSHKSKTKKENVPEYESQYDAPKADLSISGADEIERDSWQVTARLVGDIECEEDALVILTAKQANEPISNELSNYKDEEEQVTQADCYNLKKENIQLIKEIMQGRVSAYDLEASEKINEINEAFAEHFGDVIIEAELDEYKIIDDYLEEVKLWLSKTRM